MIHALLPALLVHLAGGDPVPADRLLAECGGQALGHLVGRPLDDVAGLPPDARLLRPGTRRTMDYVADRLNVHVDAGGTLIRLECG